MYTPRKRATHEYRHTGVLVVQFLNQAIVPLLCSLHRPRSSHAGLILLSRGPPASCEYFRVHLLVGYCVIMRPQGGGAYKMLVA